MKPKVKPTGAKFDDYQVNALAALIKTQRETKILAESEFWTALVELWNEGNKQNPFYKKTPGCFCTLTVFYVQAAKAFKQVVPTIKTPETTWDVCYYLYSNSSNYTYHIPGGNWPDVSMSRAVDILKTLKVFEN